MLKAEPGDGSADNPAIVTGERREENLHSEGFHDGSGRDDASEDGANRQDSARDEDEENGSTYSWGPRRADATEHTAGPTNEAAVVGAPDDDPVPMFTTAATDSPRPPSVVDASSEGGANLVATPNTETPNGVELASTTPQTRTAGRPDGPQSVEVRPQDPMSQIETITKQNLYRLDPGADLTKREYWEMLETWTWSVKQQLFSILDLPGGTENVQHAITMAFASAGIEPILQELAETEEM